VRTPHYVGVNVFSLHRAVWHPGSVSQALEVGHHLTDRRLGWMLA